MVKNRIINKASKWEGDPQSAHRLFSESKSLCCVVLGVVVVEVSVEYLVIYIYIYIEREREREREREWALAARPNQLPLPLTSSTLRAIFFWGKLKSHTFLIKNI